MFETNFRVYVKWHTKGKVQFFIFQYIFANIHKPRH